MKMKKLVGNPPSGINTRKSSTSNIIESVNRLGGGEYIEIECSYKQANAIRQSIYRHCPSKKCRVNATSSEGVYKCIIHRRDKEE
jgi:hypothetical protein